MCNITNKSLYIIIFILGIIGKINCFYPSSYQEISSSSTGIIIQNKGGIDHVHYGNCDINGDGFDDIIFSKQIIGSSAYEMVYVVFGPLSRYGQDLYTLDLDSMISNAENGFRVSIKNYIRVKCADLNNDGIDDMVIRLRNGSNGGAAIIYGHSGNFENITGLSDIDGNNGFIINGENGTSQSLGSTCTFCDINGDGINDLIIGSNPLNYGTESPAGTPIILVLYGINSGKYQTNNGNYDVNLILNGTSGFYINYAPFSLGCIDLNSDGVGDLVMNRKKMNSSVVFGKRKPLVFTSPYTITLNGEEGLSLSPIDTFTSSDARYETGDFNGDGIKDSVLTSRADDSKETVYIIYGSSSSIKLSSILDLNEYTDGIRGRKFIGGDTNPGSSDNLCMSLMVSDVDGDGIDDILCMKVSINQIWGVYGTTNQFPATTKIFPSDSPVNDKCTGFKILSDNMGYDFQSINFKNQTGPKDLLFTRGLTSNPAYSLLAYYGEVRTFSDFSIINSVLNINQTSYYQNNSSSGVGGASSYNSSINDHGISFLNNNYIETIRMCDIRSIRISIINPDLGDRLALENLYPLDYDISNSSNYEITVSNLNKSTPHNILNITSSILFYKDSSITNTTTTNIQLSFINSSRKENIKINVIRLTTNNSSGGSGGSNDSSNSNSNESSSNSYNSNSISSESDSKVGVIVGSIIGGVAGLAILIFIILYLFKRNKNKSIGDISLKSH